MTTTAPMNTNNNDIHLVSLSTTTKEQTTHSRTSSRDNSYCSDLSDLSCVVIEQEEMQQQAPKIVVEHISDQTLMEVSLLSKEFLVEENKNNKDEPIHHHHHDLVSVQKENVAAVYGMDDEDDCTTVTLSTSITSDERSGSNNSGSRALMGGWAARFVPSSNTTTNDNTLPMKMDLDNVSPLSTSSPSSSRRKGFNEQQVMELPPLKQFGAQLDEATLQMQALEAIMAKQQQKQQQQQQQNKKNGGGRWFWKNNKDGQQQKSENSGMEEDSVAAESMTSYKSNDGETSTSFRWGRFLGSSNDTINGEEEEEDDPKEILYSNRNKNNNNNINFSSPKRKSWKNRFSFRPSQMDTMLDDIDDPYLDSVSLGSESSSSGSSSLSVYSLESNDPNNEQEQEGTSSSSSNNNHTKTHRRRWSRLWRAQEFSRDAPTIHMI